jgi:hypothetical protein
MRGPLFKHQFAPENELALPSTFHGSSESTIPPVREVAAGLWHWQLYIRSGTTACGRRSAPVSSYAIDDGERLLVFDPISPPDELVEHVLATHGGPHEGMALERALA